MRLLGLFSGTGNVGRAFAERGWEVTSLDVRFEPTIKQDILQWDYMKHAAPGLRLRLGVSALHTLIPRPNHGRPPGSGGR